MIKLADHINPETDHIDFASFERARIEAGEVCDTCGRPHRWVMGRRHSCVACDNLKNNPAPQTHTDDLRCSHCGHIHNALDLVREEWRTDGEYQALCTECNRTFGFQIKMEHRRIMGKHLSRRYFISEARKEASNV